MRSSLDDVFSSTQDTLADEESAYPDCMSQHGFKVDNYVELEAKIRGVFENVSEGIGTQAWDDAVATEKDAAAADTDCRSGLYDHAMQLLQPKLQTWMGDHQDELSQLDAAWSAMVDQAAQYPDWNSVNN